MIRKRFVILFLCMCLLSGCASDKKGVSKQVDVSSEKYADLTEYLEKLYAYDCTLSWDYNGSVGVDNINMKESSSGNLDISYGDNLRFINGNVNHEVYQNSGVDNLDYYVTSDNEFYVKDDNESLFLTYDSTDVNSSIKSILENCNLVEEDSSYLGECNLTDTSKELYGYLFGDKFVCNKDFIVDVKVNVSGDDITSVKFSKKDFRYNVTNINSLEITYSFRDSKELSLSSDYHQWGLPVVEDKFEYPSEYTFLKGYAYPKESLLHYINGNEMGYGYGDYILDGKCLVDTTQVKDYSIYSADESNVNTLGSTIYTYTSSNNSYNYNPIYIQVLSYGHSELSDNLMNLYNSYCDSNFKITPKDGEETRYFTVTYTVPIDSSKIYYEPDFIWYTGVDVHDAICCNDVTEATATSTFRFGSGCQITKYYVYCIDKNVTGEWFSTSLREGLNSSFIGNVYWR